MGSGASTAGGTAALERLCAESAKPGDLSDLTGGEGGDPKALLGELLEHLSELLGDPELKGQDLESMSVPDVFKQIGTLRAIFKVQQMVPSAAPEPDEIRAEGFPTMGVAPIDASLGPFWSSNIEAEAQIRVDESDPTPSFTLPEAFKRAVERSGEKIALRVERPVPPLNEDGSVPPSLPMEDWTTWTFSQYYDQVQAVAKGLIALGHERHESVSIFGANAPEWNMAALGAIFARGRPAGIYPTDTSKQLAYKSKHANASIAVLETSEHFEKFALAIEDMPNIKAIVCWAYEGRALSRKNGAEIKVVQWEELIKLGSEDSLTAQLEERVAEIKPGHGACLIYTSGTTGKQRCRARRERASEQARERERG